jgi:hypothetical protein
MVSLLSSFVYIEIWLRAIFLRLIFDFKKIEVKYAKKT